MKTGGFVLPNANHFWSKCEFEVNAKTDSQYF